MAGNVLGKGYTAGVGSEIGTAFGRIGRQCRIGRTKTARSAAQALTAGETTSKPCKPFEALTRDAKALANGDRALRPEAEVGARCRSANACRYCEGFCAAFPAMTRG